MTPERVEAYIEVVATQVRQASRRFNAHIGGRCARRASGTSSLPPSSLQRAYFLYPKAEAHPDEWLRTLGYDPTIRKPASAPDDFTARVMARVAVNQEQIVSAATGRISDIGEWAEDTARTARRVALERASVVAAIVGFAALLALISGCAITILAPRAVLMFLGTLLTIAVAALAGARAILALVLNAASNDGLLLALAALPLGALLVGSRLARQSSDTLRQV